MRAGAGFPCLLVGAVVLLTSAVAEVTYRSVGTAKQFRADEAGEELASYLDPPSGMFWESRSVRWPDTSSEDARSDLVYWVAAKMQLVRPAGSPTRTSGVFEITSARAAPPPGPSPSNWQPYSDLPVFKAQMTINSDDSGPSNVFGTRTIVVGPFRRERNTHRKDPYTVITKVRLLSQQPVSLLIQSISEAYCYDCPTGTRATRCDPMAGRSTKCEPCDESVEPGRYCHGAQPEYSFQVVLQHDPEALARESLPYTDSNSNSTPPSVSTSHPVRSYSYKDPYSFQDPVTELCPEGATCSAGKLTTCDCVNGQWYFCFDGPSRAGLYCPAGTGAASPALALCPAGYFCPDVRTRTPCPEGNYCPKGSSSGELPCPDGSVSPKPGAAACTVCDPLWSYGVDVENLNACKCKPGAFGPTCEPGASRPISGGNNGPATGGGASPGGGSASGRAPAGGGSAVTIVASCVAALALVAIAALVAKRRREASAARQPAPGAELSV
jgi:hypothetical protein